MKMNYPNCPPPADWNFAKDGTWLFCAHSDDFIPIYAQGGPAAEPRIIAAYTPQQAAGLAIGLLRAIGELDEHRQLIEAVNDAFPDDLD